MKIIETKKVSSIVGEFPFWAENNKDQLISTKIWYAGGINEIDSNYDVSKPRLVSFSIYKYSKGLCFTIDTTLFNRKSLVILDGDLKKITYTDSSLVIKKRMGAIGKGLIGGAILGPAGLVLGALKGHSDSNADKNTSLLVNIYFQTENKKKLITLNKDS